MTGASQIPTESRKVLMTKTNRTLPLAVASLLVFGTVTVFAAPSGAATVAVVASSADGDVFDLDEYSDGDIAVQVVDRDGAPADVKDARDLSYHWKVVPFEESEPRVRVPSGGEDLAETEMDGRFTVPLPTGQPSGTYVLFSGLDSESVRTLSVTAGQASITLDDEDPLLVPVATDHPVRGTLALEDGTTLAGRVLDLTFDRGGAGTDPAADAGLRLADESTATVQQATTNRRGRFVATIADAVEDGQGTELGGSLTVASALTPGVGDVGASSALGIDLVSIEPPTGSVVVVDSLGSGTPGQALGSSVTTLAPDDSFDTDPMIEGVQGDPGTDPDLVEGQVVELSADHGFFTSGEATPSEPGQITGNLAHSGDALTALTDAGGEVPFALGIARDTDFDDDAEVVATVSAAAGSVAGEAVAEWDTANPFNGRVSIVLSPSSEQNTPVDPALAGNRTFYEVLSTDQFGNPVDGQPISLSYSGNLDEWDYSDDFVVSDLDTNGDIWLVNYETGTITVTGTWADAPTRVFTDANGSAVSASDDVTGSVESTSYGLKFARSSFRLRSSATSTVAVGATVSETVTVRDQLGNPVRGYEVSFFRYGPDSYNGEPRARVQTNARGQATYTFMGAKLGDARITAVITDGSQTTSLSGRVVFGAQVRVTARGANRSGKDLIRVSAGKVAAGTRAVLHHVDGPRRPKIGSARLNADGEATFSVRDRNRGAKTSYWVKVLGTATTAAAESKVVRIK